MTRLTKIFQLILCSATISCCFMFSGSAHAEVVRTGYSTIVSASSGKCLDIYMAWTTPNVVAVQSHCSFASDQQWTVSSAGQGFNNAFKIVEQKTGLCLDAYQASVASGALVVDNTCGTGTDELWNFMPSGSGYLIVNVKSKLCMNVDGSNLNANGNTTADNAIITQKACSSAANFIWSVSSGLITSGNAAVVQAAHSGQCLFANGSGSNGAGSSIVQNPCAGTPAEQWYFYPYNSHYVIYSASNSLCMTVGGSGASSTLVQATCTGNPIGSWSLVPVGGSYQLVSQVSGLCLTVPGASQTALAATGLVTCGGATAAPLNQLWSLSAAKLASSWSAVESLPIVPAAMANLPNGQLVTWSAFQPALFEGDIGNASGQTYTSVFDPISGNATNVLVTNTGDDMFCPGTTNLADGRILVNGGSSSPKTSIYNPTTGTWVSDAVMNIPRGYQGNTLLSTGSVLTFGGSWSGPAVVKNAEMWTKGAGWSVLAGLPTTDVLGNDADTGKDDNHLWLFAQSNGQVFHAGPSAQMNWITTTGIGSITSLGNRADDPYSINGKAVMYDVGMIMKTGGAPDYDNATAEASTYVININSAPSKVVVTKTAPMAYPRTFANGTVLPNGQIVITGGQTYASQWDDSYSVLIPELWDPQTQVFRQLAPAQTPRNYHSTSILLQDGRVLAAGGGLCYFDCGSVNHLNGEILTPPYLLNADGSTATRPVLSNVPATATHGSNIAVTAASPVVSFVLMRLSSVTHSVNNDQRRIPLQMASTNGNSYTLTLPADPGNLLPGYYWLFALNVQGVPSVGSTVLIN